MTPREGTAKKPDGRAEVRAAIAEMPEPDRTLAAQLAAIVETSAPSLAPRMWYGMPAWAKGGKVVVFFQAASKFKTRYSTLGFQHEAALDEGEMWPVAFALRTLGDAEAERVSALVKRAAG